MQSGQQPCLHVAHARPERPLAGTLKRPRGSGPRLENGVHVPDQQEPRSDPGEAPDHEVSEPRLGSLWPVGDSLDRGTQPGQ